MNEQPQPSAAPVKVTVISTTSGQGFNQAHQGDLLSLNDGGYVVIKERASGLRIWMPIQNVLAIAEQLD
jgi:hypothetical protein